MDIETIIYDKYTIKVELYNEQIKINITDNTFFEIYKGIINEDDTNIKPIKKFYSMIIKALNRDQFYNFTITNQESVIFCNISYNDDMFNLDEHIFLEKISASESKELLLINKITELQNMLTPVFGRNIKTGEPMKFKLDSEVLDFRIFNNEYDVKTQYNKYIFFNNTLLEFNKFTNARKVIFDVELSPIYTNIINRGQNNLYMLDYLYSKNYSSCSFTINDSVNIFGDMYYISLPLVSELEICFRKQFDISWISSPYYLRSFPNLKKITVTCSDGVINSNIWGVDEIFDLSQHVYKKLNHIVIKNIILDPVELSHVQECSKQFNIKFEMI